MFRSSGAIARPFRSRWFSGDVNLVIDKGVLDISRVRQRATLSRPPGQLAARSGQVLNTAAISGTIAWKSPRPRSTSSSCKQYLRRSRYQQRERELYTQLPGTSNPE
jgi:hypothetical protein